MPKTFRDAVDCAHRLGVRYVWIDSLCIIQDSNEDWLHQSSLMAEIYAMALLNIAATSSANAEEGLFHVRDPVAINSHYLEPPKCHIRNARLSLCRPRLLEVVD